MNFIVHNAAYAANAGACVAVNLTVFLRMIYDGHVIPDTEHLRYLAPARSKKRWAAVSNDAFRHAGGLPGVTNEYVGISPSYN